MKSLVWNMHGLIFETSIWLLAGSTRCLHWCQPLCAQVGPKKDSPARLLTGVQQQVPKETVTHQPHSRRQVSWNPAFFTNCTQCNQELASPTAAKAARQAQPGAGPSPGARFSRRPILGQPPGSSSGRDAPPYIRKSWKTCCLIPRPVYKSKSKSPWGTPPDPKHNKPNRTQQEPSNRVG